jgi:peptide subunit release factor 1 (eRF1)
MATTELQARLRDLAEIRSGDSPVISVYLNTRWADEQQRDRVRLFLKNELRRARREASGRTLEADLAWIESEGGALIARTLFPEAHGIALFACQAVGLREVIPVGMPFEDAWHLADIPHLLPLAALGEEAPPALVAFVDGERARLIPFGWAGADDEVTLQSEVPGQHRRGDWALLAQSRYERHIEAHRGQHFEAVAATLAALAERHAATRLVLAGEARMLAAFRDHLPGPLAARIVGTVAGTRYEPAADLVARAAALLPVHERAEEAATLDAIVTAAAKGGRAAAGLATMEAVARGAVDRLYLLRRHVVRGRECPGCASLFPETDATCRLCGQATRSVDLAEALADRVLATGGSVEVVEAHPGLERLGGIAARLRYAM